MNVHGFHGSLKMVFKGLALLFTVVILLFGLPQFNAQAASTRAAVAAEADDADQLYNPIPEAKLDRLREKRREWQSEASAAASEDSPYQSGPGAVLRDRLNLKEIIEGNEPMGNARSLENENPSKSH